MILSSRSLRILLVLLALPITGCQLKEPSLTVEPKKSEMDKMIDKKVEPDEPAVQEVAALSENTKIVSGEDPTKSSQDVKDVGSQDDTGAVAVKTEY